MARLVVEVDDDLLTGLAEEADADGVSLDTVLRRAIKTYAEPDEDEDDE